MFLFHFVPFLLSINPQTDNPAGGAAGEKRKTHFPIGQSGRLVAGEYLTVVVGNHDPVPRGGKSEAGWFRR